MKLNLERNIRPYEVKSIFIKISRALILAWMSTIFKCVQLADSDYFENAQLSQPNTWTRRGTGAPSRRAA